MDGPDVATNPRRSRPEAVRTKRFWLSSHARPLGVVQMTSLRDSDVVESLQAAGYDRGASMTHLVASRLYSVGPFIADRGVERATEVLSSGRPEEVHAMWRPDTADRSVWNYPVSYLWA
jgi:hypothetical protein